MDNEITTTENIRAKIYEIRGQKVMLDRGLAALYGVETRRINEQVKRNINIHGLFKQVKGNTECNVNTILTNVCLYDIKEVKC